MKLAEIIFADTNCKANKICRNLAWHITRTEEIEDDITQIDLIEAGIEEDKRLGILNEKEYMKERALFTDIALYNFK